MLNIVKRDLRIEGFCLSIFTYKNLSFNELDELVQSLAGQTWEGQSAILSCTIWADKLLQKNWQKKIDEVFDEANWPVFWIDRPKAKPELTGCFVAISGSTVKTLVSDDFTSKTFDSPLGRILFGGNFNTGKDINPDKQVETLFQNITKAMMFSGMSTENLMQIKTSLPPDCSSNLIQSKLTLSKPVSTFTANQPKSAISTSIIALQPISGAERTDSLQNLTQGTIASRVIMKEHLQWFELLVQADIRNETKEKTEATLLIIEEQLLKQQLTWKNLVIGYIYTEQPEIIKAIKEICKEKQIPMSSMLIIENCLPEIEKNICFHLTFLSTT